MAAKTRFLVAGRTASEPFATRETVCVETPATFATSAIDTLVFGFRAI
jgi:hypothetical protein